MKRLLISTSVTAFLVMLALPAPAQTPPPKRAQVQADLANLLNQEVELKEQSKKIDARDRDETEKNVALAKDIAAYDAEQARLTQEDRRYVNTVTSHNGRCGGTYTDKTHVDQCNNRKRDLDAWQSAIVGRDAALSKRHGELDARSKELQKEMDETARRKRENQASLQRVAKAIAAKREVVRLLDDSVVSDLRKREHIGRNCADLPTIEQVKACAAQPFSQ
jgi:chromosome segregation ATPase